MKLAETAYYQKISQDVVRTTLYMYIFLCIIVWSLSNNIIQCFDLCNIAPEELKSGSHLSKKFALFA